LIRSSRAFGPANIDRPAEAGAGHESDRRERARMQSPWPSGDVEDTDLERRVLTHERILQALIAHMAEAEPKFVAHLNAVFSEPLLTGRREHDFTDTHAYADQFVRKVRQLMEHRGERGEAREATPSHLRAVTQHNDVADASEGRAITRLEVKRRVGIWEVTRDGHFYGHYQEAQPAFDAAEAAALAIVANGGAADLLWNDTRPQSGVSDQARDVAVSRLSRVIEFRSGSTTIVRPHLRGAP
jgi:hypothetical protein